MSEKLRKSQYLNRSLWLLYQIATAQFYIAVHSSISREQLLRVDETKLYNDLADEAEMITNVSQSEEDRGNPHLHFGHLVSSYDAYLWLYLPKAPGVGRHGTDIAKVFLRMEEAETSGVCLRNFWATLQVRILCFGNSVMRAL
ncbi:hypothetical protein GGS23DRAFT_595186 [Durotheca rogersii]|uniref:uncharacterized protein n=1 Tax=Durotheca rogersii TaxID=419775 RepID=UPI00221F2E6D|nr:uncharacterized protein GGS23DRAFT_595186 [Durotheca rogersii]KAI5865671.1 hypothetical protein GGS23DRAFT_595186 [Durotheca rogersii]